MAKIRNASLLKPLRVQVIHGKHGELESFVLNPGETNTLARLPNSPIDKSPIETGRGVYSFYHMDSPQADNPMFWSGTLRFRDDVDVNPGTSKLSIPRSKITQSALDAFKAHIRSDPNPNSAILQITLDQLATHAATRDHWGNSAVPLPNRRQARGLVSPCRMAVAECVLDCVLVAWGAWGLHGKISPAAIEEVAEAITPVLSEIEQLVMTISDAGKHWFDRTKAVWSTLLLIKNGLMFEAVFHALIKDLTLMDMVLYGVLGLAELTAAFLTDGAALIAEMVVELASAVFLITDGLKAVEVCGLRTPAHA